MSNMVTSLKGALEIAEHEGIVPAPYKDSVGVLTYGIGHTFAAGAPNPAKMDMAMPKGTQLEARVTDAVEVFRRDLKKYEARVNKAIKVPLKQYEFDALVSFDFNTGGIGRAKLTAAINRGDADAYRHFMGWLRPPEIRKRRTAEMNLFRSGDYSANGDRIPIWKTNGKGKLTGILREMGSSELAKRMGRIELGKMPPYAANAPEKPSTIRENPFLAILRAILSAFTGRSPK